MGSPKPKKEAKTPLSELDKLKAENVKLRDENKALKKKQAEEKQAADEVQACQLKVDACKNRTSAAKEELAEAQAKLSAIVRGDAQQTHPALVGGSKANAKRYALPKDQQIGEKEHGFTAKELQEKAVHKIAPSDKPPAISPDNVHSVKGSLYIVRDFMPEVSPSRFFAQQLHTIDEWQQLYEKDFGRNVLGFDQGDDAKAQRQKGGEDCGRTVHVGRKKYVLAPESAGLVLICESAETKTQTDATTDDDKPVGKEAAAGKEPEELTVDEDEAEED